MDLSYCNHARFKRRQIPGSDRLKRENSLGCHHNRINAEVGPCGMGRLARQGGSERARGRIGGARSVGNRPNWPVRKGVKAKHCIRAQISKETFLQHKGGSAFFPLGRSFFSWLKNENDSAGNLFSKTGKYRRSTQQHRNMNVVTAGM